jgi:ketosteroid isomerase-like protein
VIELATAVLHALARSDVDALDLLCHEDVVIWGTDEDEAWHGKADVLRAFRGTYDLSVRWLGEPASGDGWAAGLVEFGQEGADPVRSRVTMVFAAGLLAHAHYSVALPSQKTPPSRVPGR